MWQHQHHQGDKDSESRNRNLLSSGKAKSKALTRHSTREALPVRFEEFQMLHHTLTISRDSDQKNAFQRGLSSKNALMSQKTLEANDEAMRTTSKEQTQILELLQRFELETCDT